MNFLVFGVLREPQPWPVLCGPDDQAVTPVSAVGLTAACSLVHAQSENPTTPQLLRFANVVDALFRHATFVPFRYGCLLASEAMVANLLRTRQEEFVGWLEAVDDCTEMGLRLIHRECNPTACSQAFSPVAASSSGTAYLNARRAHFGALDARRRLDDEKTSQVRQAFGDLTVRFAADTHPAGSNAPLAFYFLIRRGDVDLFTERFHLFRKGNGDTMLLTGPWPPYHFVAGSLTEALHVNKHP